MLLYLLCKNSRGVAKLVHYFPMRFARTAFSLSEAPWRESTPLEMHALLIWFDTILVFRTHFIPLLCVFYTLFILLMRSYSSHWLVGRENKMNFQY
jgi:hypothetical protein